MSAAIHTEYLIIGQGICGTFLSYYLQKAGKEYLVIDESKPHTASKVASGVINPVTGRRIVRTWMIEEVMPFAVSVYTEIGRQYNVQLVKQCNILDFHPTAQMQLAFNERLKEESYLRLPQNQQQWNAYFNYPFSIGETNPCYLVDLRALLTVWRNQLHTNNRLIEEHFEIDALNYANRNYILYNNIKAEKIIFCDGAAGINNLFFNKLPYAQNKGEAIIARIEKLPDTNIYKQGIVLVPWEKDLFWIGSTYDWDFENINPTDAFRLKVETQLKHWLKLDYTIMEHWASLRPANMERRPFAGFHPLYPAIGILNGMGTKGCTLGPFFANQLVNCLTQQTPIQPLADVQRFTRILSR